MTRELRTSTRVTPRSMSHRHAYSNSPRGSSENVLYNSSRDVATKKDWSNIISNIKNK